MPHRLTQYRLCPRSRSVRLALAEHRIDVELSEEKPWEWRQSFLAKNPAGELPVLELENGLMLCGAYSISEFIAEDMAVAGTPVSPAPPALFPGSREDRAEIRRLVDWYHGKFDREVTRELLVEKVYNSMRPTGPIAPDPGVLRAVRANLRYHLSYTGYLADSAAGSRATNSASRISPQLHRSRRATIWAKFPGRSIRRSRPGTNA